MDKRLAGKQYFTGKLSIADFSFGAYLASTAYNPAYPHQKAVLGIVAKFKNVEAFYANFAKVNEAHLKSRPVAPF